MTPVAGHLGQKPPVVRVRFEWPASARVSRGHTVPDSLMGQRCTRMTSCWRGSQALPILVLSLLLGPGSALAQAALIYPRGAWTREAPERTGWSAEKLQAADDVARSIGTGAYLVVHKGVVVHACGAVDQPMNLASARKSVLSILYGIAVDRHEIDINKSLTDLGTTDSGGLSDTEKQATVRELLEARSGIYHPAAYETSEMKANRPGRGSHPPGTFWYYNNWDFNAWEASSSS